MTRQDIVDFLDRLRKPEQGDPLHKWIGSYEVNCIVLLRFFKWLHYPDVVPHNKRPKPAVVENIPKIKRKGVSTYKATDLWTEEDDIYFTSIVLLLVTNVGMLLVETLLADLMSC